MPGFQSTRLAMDGALEPFFFLYTDDSIQGNPETCKQSSIMLNYEVKNIVKISVSGLPEETEYAYMNIAGVTFDLRREDGGESGDSYTVTVEKERFQEEDMEITDSHRKYQRTVYFLKYS